jgi:hypothetical protein
MLFAFLMFGSFWFWAALAIPAILLIAFVENEKGFGAFFTMVGTIVVFVAFGDKHWLGNVFPWIMHNPLHLVAYVLAYIVVGIAYGFAKWALFLLRVRDKYEEVRKQFLAHKDDYVKGLANRRLRSVREGLVGGIEEAVANEQAKIDAERREIDYDKKLFHSYLHYNAIPKIERPLAKDNKGRIIFWMSYWPFSGIWTLINDPITRMYRFIWYRLGEAFENMSKAMFAKYKGEI